MATDKERYKWRFFRAGGFDQVRIDRGSDLANLKNLDQKLWAALACPTQGIDFDERTLALIDTDKDGRIRVPEILAAIDWTLDLLKCDHYLDEDKPGLAVGAISDAHERGRRIAESANLILEKLGKPSGERITLEDTLDVERIFSATPFNGDGIITVDSAGDGEIAAALNDIMACLGSETDRCRKPGVSQALVDRFFAEAASVAQWRKDFDPSRSALAPLGGAVTDAAMLLDTVSAKLDDYFTRVSLAEVDHRAVDALNAQTSIYEAMSPGLLKLDDPAIVALPLARIEAGRPLTLTTGLNPAWRVTLHRFRDEIAGPLLGKTDELTKEDWDRIKKMFADHAAWLARAPQTPVAGLPPERLNALLNPQVRTEIELLIARDKALEPQMNAIADVERLLRMKRDLLPLLNNFASFKDFYTRSAKAVFQAGTLYLDGRSCELCVKVDDEANHAELATLSRIYLVYCRCRRSGGTEVMKIAAAFTAGDARNLRIGRNGLFYDRKGRDWDATIVRIIEHPISLRQAFWLPYQQFARFVSEQVQKLAAARAAAQQARMNQEAIRVAAAATTAQGAPQPQQPQQPQQAFDVARFAGIFAAIGLAIGAIGTALASIMTGFVQLAWWQMPLVIAGIILLISGPSCLIAIIKLQSRNLGPILDACGWAVNTRLKINLAFGRALTAIAALPPGAERSLTDPYADRKPRWPLYLIAALLLAGGYVLWKTGILTR